MRDTIGRITSMASRFAGDRVLQMLVIGVIAFGFFAVLVLGADPSLAVGLVVIGLTTAFIERAHRRDGP
jgi:hypothetical protein